ncbi:MAG: AMP-binding protein [Alphaproteobacteria bacterium]|nr:AMP-binding protein [Alphaproteobacteria bacterium]
MRLDQLVPSLPTRKGAIITLFQGKPVRHPYAALAEDVARARALLVRWNVKAGMRVGIFAPNSYAYIVYDLALVDLKAISVPFTDDFAGMLNRELVDQYDISLMLLAKGVRHGFGEDENFVALIDAENENVSALPRAPFSGSDDPDDLCLAFSSGSAGGLKGLVISRKGAELTLPPVAESINLGHQDRLLLFLPMSNFQQRNMYYAAIWYDFDIIVTEYTQLYPAMKLLQPTVLIAPPILYQLLHTRFSAPGSKNWRQVLAGALASLPLGRVLRRKFAQFAYKEIHAIFGGKMRLLISGMAPLSRGTIQFFERAQLPLCESYGLAEAGSLTYRPAFSRKYGSVGKPLAGVRISFEADGEIIVHRERFLTRRYFQCAPGENESTFIAAGQVATGDIGRFDSDGYLYLLGRKKELIVTPGGYKVHPEMVEGELNACEDIVQSVVFQKPGLAHLTCVVVPGQDRSDDAVRRIRRHVEGAMAGKKIRIGEVKLAEEPFSKENGMLRPNLKLNRKNIAAKYAAA